LITIPQFKTHAVCADIVYCSILSPQHIKTENTRLWPSKTPHSQLTNHTQFVTYQHKNDIPTTTAL